MKYLKYIFMALTVAFVATSCDKRDPDFNAEQVSKDKAEVQVFLITPVQNVSANYVHAVILNDDVHANKGSALLNPYNGAPGGTTGAYWTVPAGNTRVRLQRATPRTERILDWQKPVLDDGTENWKDTTYYDYETIYDKVVTGLEGGKKYFVFVYDFDKAPMAIDQLEPPTQTSTNTAEYAAVRFINFMWENPTTPYAGKVQLRMQDATTKEYINTCDPIGFGEATAWFMPSVIKTSFNSGGSQRRDLDVAVVNEDGEVGERMLYTNSKGNKVGFTDYWTLSIGRGYVWILYGTRDVTVQPVAIRQWTLR